MSNRQVGPQGDRASKYATLQDFLDLFGIVDMVPGYTYYPFNGFQQHALGNANNNTFAINKATGWPIYIPQTFTFNSIGLNITTAVASSFVELAIYGSNPAGDPTGSPIFVSAPIDTSATGFCDDATQTFQLPAGLYWFFWSPSLVGLQYTAISCLTLAAMTNHGTTTPSLITTGGFTFTTFNHTYGGSWSSSPTAARSAPGTAFICPYPHWTCASFP